MNGMNTILKNLQFKCGIYIFTNLENGKRYIGSSKNLYSRLHEHVHNLNSGKAHNKHFQSAWNKYGEENFVYGILEYCPEENQFVREQYYLDFMQPEYNKSGNVVANIGASPTKEVRAKISQTLKTKYASGEITTYRQEHTWVKTWIYNVKTLKLEVECPCRADALNMLRKTKNTAYREYTLFNNRYCISSVKFTYRYELLNYISKYIMVANSKFGKYIISENQDGFRTYYRDLTSCARDNFTSKSTLSKHSNASIDNPYVMKKTNNKFYYSNEFLPFDKDAVLIEESSELLQTNIGEGCDANTEISIGSKNPIPSYSVGIEPEKSE